MGLGQSNYNIGLNGNGGYIVGYIFYMKYTWMLHYFKMRAIHEGYGNNDYTEFLTKEWLSCRNTVHFSYDSTGCI